jgi:hypothetical protein
MYVPRRCEYKGCDKRGYGDKLKSCSRCNCSFYCGKEHQAADWGRHKLDCKFLSKLSIESKAFTIEEELEKHPVGCFPISSSTNDVNDKCFICHSKTSEVNITYTKCCNMPVCDNSHEYVPCSYSRDFCERNHNMYTACNRHDEEEHDGDWRNCTKCNSVLDGCNYNHTPVRRFQSTNRIPVTPCFERFIPQGSMIIFPCGNYPTCKNRMLPGHSSVSYHVDKAFCDKCS